MAVVADVLDEFKQASPGGKALMLVAIIAVAGVGIYVYKQKSASSQGSAGTLVPIDSGGSGSGTSGFSGGSSSSGSTSGTGNGTLQGSNPPHTPFQPPIGVTNPKPVSTPSQPPGVWVTVTKTSLGEWSGSLWGMAQHFYGNGALWQRIAQANNNQNPRTLRVGQRIFVPGAS